MDVLALIDKLDDLIHNARTVPFSDKVAIEREEIYELLDQMRSTIPEASPVGPARCPPAAF